MQWTTTAAPALGDGVVIFKGLRAKTSYLATVQQILELSGANPTFGTATVTSLAFTGGAVATADVPATYKLQVYIGGVPYYFLLVADLGG